MGRRKNLVHRNGRNGMKSRMNCGISAIGQFFQSLEGRVLMSTINITDFGAKANDGGDDTGAIRAAIKASGNGDTINFGSGSYNISDQIQLTSNRTYSGSATIRRGGQGYIFKNDGTNTNITITGLTLDGGGIDASWNTAVGFVAKNNTIKNVTGGYPVGEGIFLGAGARNTSITNNSFINIMGETGIYGFNNFENVTISNNYFDTTFEGIHLSYDGGGSGLYIRNNTFIRTHRMAVEIQGKNARDIYVEGNVASEWSNPYDGSFFLSIVQMGTNINVKNNHASSGKFGQIDSNASNVPVGLEISGKGVTVFGNVIENFREGVHLMNIRDAVVENNTFWNQTWMGIWRTGVSTGDFNGNNLTIQNNTVYGSQVTAIMFMGSSTGVIRNNTISLFGGAVEYWVGSYAGVNRAGNTVLRPSGSKQAYTGNAPRSTDSGSTSSGTSGGSTTTTTPPPVVAPSQPSSGGSSASNGNGNGLTAQYFDNSDLTGLKATRTDSNVNFDWGTNSPVSGMSGDTFSARWTGQILARYSEEYTFYAGSDDGIRLWVNGQLVVDAWKDRGYSESSGKIRLEAGKKYDIKVEYYDNLVNARATIAWSSASQGKEFVPQSQLFTSTAPVEQPDTSGDQVIDNVVDTGPSGNGDGLTAQYFDNSDLTNLKLSRIDPKVNFDWGNGSPASSIGAESFSVRWTGQVLARYSEEYTFYAGSDDGTRVYVNGQLVVDAWRDRGYAESSGKIRLEAGKKYDIKVEFYDNLVSARSTLSWSSSSQSKEIVPQSQLFSSSTSSGTTNSGGSTSNSSGGSTSSPSGSSSTNGLTAQYYDNMDLTNLKVTRVDSNVNFDWNEDVPVAGVGADTFSVRWSGQIQPQYTEEYTFFGGSDDGIRVYVNGQLVVNAWQDRGFAESSGKIKLEAGKKYDIKVEFYDNGWSAQATLSWASASQAKQIVPTSQLFSNTAVV